MKQIIFVDIEDILQSRAIRNSVSIDATVVCHMFARRTNDVKHAEFPCQEILVVRYATCLRYPFADQAQAETG